MIYSTFLAPVIRMAMRKLQNRRLRNVDSLNPNELVRRLEHLPLFTYFNKELLGMVVSKSELKNYPMATPVVLQGDMGKELFVLLDGEVAVQRRVRGSPAEYLGEILPTAIFGEVAVIDESPRTADIIATKDSTILSIPAAFLRQVAKESQYIREINDFKNVIMINQFFSSAPLFRDLSKDTIQMFLTRGRIENMQSKQVVFKQGSRGDGFYLIIRGAVGVAINGKPVTKIRQGGFFGEISMIADVPRTATIYAMETTVLLKINTETFWEILAQNIDMAIFIESIGRMRVQEDIDILKSVEKEGGSGMAVSK